jgi:hypothetical protein
MKTSKIIFISLLSFIALIILAATMSVRLTGVKVSEFNTTLKVNKTVLTAFSVLCMTDCHNIAIIEDDSSYIKVSTLKDQPTQLINYTLSGDTLTVKNFQKPETPIFVTVHVASRLKTIYLDNSEISIAKFKSENISLVLNNSKLIFALNKADKTSIERMDVIARNQSSVNVNSMDLDSLSLSLQNSTADLRISTKYLSGNLSDGSRIIAMQPEEITLKKDATSKITIIGN